MKRPFYYNFIYFWLCLFTFEGAFAQGTKSRYLILFKDKTGSEFSITQPQVFLSARSVSRREKMQIKITDQDLPVNQVYLNQVINQQVLLVIKEFWVEHQLIIN